MRESLGTISFSSSSRLPPSTGPNVGESRDVATGSRQAVDQPEGNRIKTLRHDDRDRRACFLGGAGRWRRRCDEDINL